ncbi:MAG: phospho-N-acetylmuramoyl-pentapeptide-transferase [Chlorobi bacterium]|nr:phospho-N-acetylmuramoyl-pentapeptide-transferase [Chlorobiota bacterium]
MLYHLFDYLQAHVDFPGIGLFRYISFRSALAFTIAFFLSLFVGKRLIAYLRRKQIGETVRDLGLEGQKKKEGTPTMGGLMIIAATLIAVLLVNDLTNIYIILLIFTILWMGTVGFIDDYIKVVKKNKEGLPGKYKLLAQAVLGVVIALTFYYHPDIKIRTKNYAVTPAERAENISKAFHPPEKSLKTTVPLILVHNEFDYTWLLPKAWRNVGWLRLLVFVAVITFIITAVSNGANLTDGLDGLAAGTSAITTGTLAILAWLSGNMIFAAYLNIMYIPGVGEISVFLAAFVGALLGFLWFNTYPASIFMGDTGSLTIGAVIGVISVFIRKEILLVLAAGIFLVETLSVLIQRYYYKFTRKFFGEPRRVFAMAPLHHHFQKKGIPEPKIVVRFWIVGMLLAVMAIASLKLR